MSFKVVPMKSKHWLLVSFFNMLFLNVTFSQITFQKTYNGAIESKGNAVIQTSDEGYIVVGSSTQAFGLTYEDAYIIKTDKQGNVEWTTFYGGPLDEVAYSVRETDDGGFIIAANTSSYGAGYWDIYLIKVDKNGNSEWTKTIGGNNDDRCYAIEQTIDGGFIIAGTTLSFGTEYYNIYLIKTDRNGNEVWAKIFGGSGGDYAYAVQETEDGGFIICGDSQSFSAGGYTDVYLIKTDNSGNLLWSKTYGGPSNEGGKAISQTTEGLDEKLDSNVETVLYRVIQECVHNAMKHAQASNLDISLIRDKDGISGTVEDNGKGFDPTDKEKFEGIGLKNIITRIEYLRGTVDFDSAPGRGTVIAMHVPLP